MGLRRSRSIWFLFGAAVVAVALGLRFGLPIYEKYRAIAEIERLGGTLQTIPGGPHWLRTQIGDERMRVFDEFVAVKVTGKEVNDSTASCLRCLEGLRDLDLSGSSITDRGMASLEGLSRLERLNLVSAPISDAAVARCLRMPRLQALDLAGTQVTDAAVAQLQSLDALESLALSSTQVTDAALDYAKVLPSLRILWVENTAVTEKGIIEFGRARPRVVVVW